MRMITIILTLISGISILGMQPSRQENMPSPLMQLAETAASIAQDDPEDTKLHVLADIAVNRAQDARGREKPSLCQGLFFSPTLLPLHPPKHRQQQATYSTETQSNLQQDESATQESLYNDDASHSHMSRNPGRTAKRKANKALTENSSRKKHKNERTFDREHTYESTLDATLLLCACSEDACKPEVTPHKKRKTQKSLRN